MRSLPDSPIVFGRRWRTVGVVLAFSLSLAIAVAAVFLTTARPGHAAGDAWPATKVALATVERVVAPRAMLAVGELEAGRQVLLAAESGGRVTRVLFASGQTVREGELLVQLNDAVEQAERLQQLARLKHAESTLSRTRGLLASKVATQEQLDEAVAARDMARGELRRIEALIAQKAIRAPFSGEIGIRRVHEGQYLQGGDPVASLVDAQALHVNVALGEQDVPHLQVGQPVELRVDAWPERLFAARISAMDPLVGSARTVQVQASLPNPDGMLLAGMYAGVRILRPDPVWVLAVPETAVTYAAYGQTVFVAKTDAQQQVTVARVAVKTGERWQGKVEVLAGLEEGERVVVSGQIKLSDGMTVEPVEGDSLHPGKPAVVSALEGAAS